MREPSSTRRVLRAVLPRPPSSSTVARRSARHRSGARHCYRHGAAAVRASEVVRTPRLILSRPLIPMCRSVREASRARIAATRSAVHLAKQGCSSSGRRSLASHEALAAVLTASLALLRRQCVVFCDRWTARDNVLDFLPWLVSYVPLGPRLAIGIAGLGGVHCFEE